MLALGLKKETADRTLHYDRVTEDYKLQDIPFFRIMHLRELLNKRPILGRSGDDLYAKDIPAWSLSRLIELCEPIPVSSDWLYRTDAYYENMIACIAWRISKESFNPQFLEEKK